jgi:hypothetical protein
MIESVMLIAIGFLWGGLAALAFMPIVHNRAVRLTQRALEADIHPSKAEVQCHKDLLSAEFAFSMRRSEIAMEQMRSRLAGQMVELGKRGDAISQLKVERNVLSAELGVLKNETREQFALPPINQKRLPRAVVLSGARAASAD